MMSKRSGLRLVAMACGLIAVTAGCGPEATPSAASTLPNLLVEAEGQVELRRQGWEDYVAVGFGTALQPGDLLRVDEGSAAAVFCGDESLWDTSPKLVAADGSEHSVPCQTGRPPRPWPDVSALRGEQEGEVPYVIYPRDTMVSSDRPSLRWHALAGVPTYVVTIIADDGQDRSPVEASGAELDWPEEWPPLEHGSTYVLVVEGGGRSSDEANEQHVGLGFSLLAAQQAQAVQAQEARVRARPISATAADLLVAELLLGQGLRAEAIGLLEELAARDSAVAVWLALGQTYLEAQCPLEGAAAYEEALEGSEASGELEAQARARFGLGLAAQLLEDDVLGQSAPEHLARARALYEQIGDSDGVDHVDAALAE
jgi:hypothetical protein